MTGITVPATLLARADEMTHVSSWHFSDLIGPADDVCSWG
jgi:hypothetical protein